MRTPRSWQQHAVASSPTSDHGKAIGFVDVCNRRPAGGVFASRYPKLVSEVGCRMPLSVKARCFVRAILLGKKISCLVVPCSRTRPFSFCFNLLEVLESYLLSRLFPLC